MVATATPPPDSLRLRLAAKVLGAWAWLAAQLRGEQSRWSLWLAVAFGTGVALYFGFGAEPPWWLGPTAALLGLAGVVSTPGERLLVVAAWLAFVAVALGLTAAQWRTARVAAPVLSASHGPAQVVGELAKLERHGDRWRYVLAKPEVAGLPKSATPERVRVSVAGADHGRLRPGARVALEAILQPPPAPAAPGAYDFQRRAYFQQLGAVGYATGKVRVRDHGLGGEGRRLARWRETLRATIASQLDQPARGIAVALLTGKRGELDESAETAMRHAGMAHLLAISGLHVGLLVGMVFGGSRALLAAVPPVALRVTGKKLAAGLALMAAAAYTAFVGAPTPTVRAFVMTAAVLLAIMADRQPLSMRLVAVAAVTLLALRPDAIIGASFQLSFAAVAALVAAYEALQPRLLAWRQEGRWWQRPALYFGGVALSSLIATAATALFVLYHFNRVALYGVAANMLAVPLTAFWVMPWGLVTYAAAPWGVGELGLVPMGWGLDGLVAIARTVSGWPAAALTLPAPPDWAFLAAIPGALWLVIWQRPWRWFGLGPLALAVLVAFLAPHPVLELDRDADGFALRGPAGKLWGPAEAGPDPFVADTWRQRHGRKELRKFQDDGAASNPDWLACGPAGCRLTRRGQRIEVLRDSRFVTQACRRADLVVILVPRRQPCPGAEIVDPQRLAAAGATSIYVQADGLRLATVAERRGRRPWTLARQDQ